MLGYLTWKRSLVFLVVAMTTLPGFRGCKQTTPLEEWIRDQIVNCNLIRQGGYLVRWETPINVNTNNIARADEAIDRYERLTGGLISFTRTTDVPTDGIVFIEGGSRNADGSPSCGNVTKTRQSQG